MEEKKYINKNFLDKDEKPLELVVDNTVSNKNPAYWESTLFSEVYLNNDLKRDFNEEWSRDYDDVVFDENGNTKKSGFAHFYNEFRNIAPDLRTLINRKLSETDTITKIIAPILDTLGWYDNCENNVQKPYALETSFTVKGEDGKNKVYRTDMLLVDDPREANYISEKETSGQRKKEARNCCIVPLEAKYWNRITDKEGNKKFDPKREDTKRDDLGRSLSFNEQILKYMDILKKKWGIVTDGNMWRLVHSEISGEAPKRCFEFKLEALLSKEKYIGEKKDDDDEFLESAKYFYLFFGKLSYIKDDTGKIFLNEVLRESRKYINSIEEDLRDRFISAMNITCNGLLRATKENGAITKPIKDDLKLIRTVAESHLFNILFIKSCESRGILPIKNSDYRKISLTDIINRIQDFDPKKYIKSRDKDYINRRLSKSLNGNNFKPKGINLYKNLIKLTEVILDGAKKDNYGFEIEGFKESVFSKEECDFAKRHCLTDEEMVQILFQLGYSKSDKALQRNYQQIPYNYFIPRQLGSIYESFLEYQLDVAQESMVYIKKGKYKKWVKLTAAIERKLKGFEPTVEKGQLFFTPDNSERKATGSYYTPDYIVQYIVKGTIGPLCEGKSSKEILELKVCDPAMGSGHFLNGALNFLTRKYLRTLEQRKSSKEIPTTEEAKRIVLDKCIYGIDINPRAVKLAKMSLWLESAHRGKKLERLDDQLKTADTLGDKFEWKAEFKEVFDRDGFDCIIGNPPYRRELEYKDLFDQIANTNLGIKYRSARMDLWYYFVHRGIEILKPNGKLGFITNSYWIAGKSAKKLVQHITSECSVEEIFFLSKLKVFNDVSGQHMMFRFRKNINKQLTNIKVPPDDYPYKNAERLVSGNIKPKLYTKKKSSLFKGGKVDIEESNEALLTLLNSNQPLEKFGLIRQGIAENPSVIGRKVNKKYGNKWNTGEGVFTLTEEEINALKLGKESSLCKPYHDSIDIDRYWTAIKPSRTIIYSTKETCPDISKFPKIEKHLNKFKELMKERRETKKGSNKWWHLHWPRDKELWKGSPKIFAFQMGRRPTFASHQGESYVPFSINVFVKSQDIDLGIEFFEGILNSALMWKWFFHNAKKRGIGLEINGNVLRKCPIKTPNMGNPKEKDIYTEIIKAVKEARQSAKKQKSKDINAILDLEMFEKKIDSLVFELYNISNEERTKILSNLKLSTDYLSKKELAA